MTAPRPVRTPGPTNTRAAIQHSGSIVIGDATRGNECPFTSMADQGAKAVQAE
jgi:hypothetical protein